MLAPLAALTVASVPLQPRVAARPRGVGVDAGRGEEGRRRAVALDAVVVVVGVGVAADDDLGTTAEGYAVDGIALFFEGATSSPMSGNEPLRNGGHCAYAVDGSRLLVRLTSPPRGSDERRVMLGVADAVAGPLRTRNRFRVVYPLLELSRA